MQREYDEKMASPVSNTPVNIGSYQPSAVGDLGTVLQRERMRIDMETSQPVAMETGVKLNAEGDDFMSHSFQDGGQSLLF